MKFKTLSALFVVFIFFSPRAFAQDNLPTIEKGKKVALHYVLTVEGNVVDSSIGKEPLVFIYGQKSLIPGFENGIKGLKAGDKKRLTLDPQDAYGPVDAKALIEVPRANFPAEPEIQPGMVFTSHDPNGSALNGTVKELRGDKVLLDFNHPLAGKKLNFEVEILTVS